MGEDLRANPSNALQASVSRLRRAIGSDAIVTAAPGYFLDVPPEAVDAGHFRRLVEAARSESDMAVRRQLFRDALSLWQGPVLVELPFEEFAQRESSTLEEMRLSALEGRIASDLEAGEGSELVPELEQLVAAHPQRESLRASQMLALYRAGRQSEALRTYTAARDALGEELGIEPGPELRALCTAPTATAGSSSPLQPTDTTRNTDTSSVLDGTNAELPASRRPPSSQKSNQASSHTMQTSNPARTWLAMDPLQERPLPRQSFSLCT